VGYVHQDIKPGNILIDEHGRAILADFGIGHSFMSASMVVGPPAYQALDDGYCDDDSVDAVPQKEDLWALGVTFFQLLFQRLLFVGESLFEIVNVIQSEGLKIPEGIDQEIAEVLTELLTLDRARRWAIDELLAHPVIAGAAGRAKDLPPVPSPSLRDSEVCETEATVCADTLPLSDAVGSIRRRSSFCATAAKCSTGLTRTKSAPLDEMGLRTGKVCP
jgi:serine/threonine protein kinase